MKELSQNQTIAVHGIAGAGSVALATALTYPLDTMKVLIQVRTFSSTLFLLSTIHMNFFNVVCLFKGWFQRW